MKYRNEISFEDNFSSNYSVSSIEEKKEEREILNLFLNANDNISSLNTLSSKLFGDEKISANDIQQGKRPICYFLSALAGLAHHRPNDVRELVKENEDGSYTVTFPGLPANKRVIKVNEPPKEIMDFYIHKGKNNSIWVPVVVSAISKYWSKNGFLRFFRSNYDAANYGGAWEGIEIVTGHVADFMAVPLNSNDKIFTKISTAINQKKLVSVSTFGKGNMNPKKTGEFRLSNVHVLTVLSTDPYNKTITIRDPYGYLKVVDNNGSLREDYSTNGIFTVDMQTFRKYFMDIAIETDKKSNFISRLRFLK
ncbi:MAG: hypothetical protein KatS3mg068_1745 [Candidatus Sericytochromatia bacterium]|nr:MAG: hypothetical protein KatS3mg068_1745 [Candidatus Sericytochromatia bacterium]